MKGVFLFLADGFEDIEALGTRDILRRAGIDVQLVGITDDPFVVSSHGLMVGIDCRLDELEADVAGIDFTCYDGFAEPMTAKGACFASRPAVTDGRIITGRGPGHTQAFALEIVKKVKGEAVAAEVAYGMNLTCE